MPPHTGLAPFEAAPHALARAATLPCWPAAAPQPDRHPPKRAAGSPITPTYQLSAYAALRTFTLPPPPPEPPLLLPALCASLAPLFRSIPPAGRLFHVHAVVRASESPGGAARLFIVDASAGAQPSPREAADGTPCRVEAAGGTEARMALARAVLAARDLPPNAPTVDALPQPEVRIAHPRLCAAVARGRRGEGLAPDCMRLCASGGGRGTRGASAGNAPPVQAPRRQPAAASGAHLTHRSPPRPSDSRPLLPPGQLDALEAALGELALPSGWFYDGSSYISEDGDRSRHHPQLVAAAQQRLKQVNAAADVANATAAAARSRAGEQAEAYLAEVARGE